ncbi:MAG: hypothetical protein H6888_08255 [Nitratireductor sp.]|nr:hypothetical protein [Nitratireductor sp.]MCC0021056.1 hypothetical protein [Nitratireductor sp.]
MTFRTKVPCFFSALLVLAITPCAVRADSLTYTNARFGTSVTFPAELYEQRTGMPENGDGILFTSSDGGSLAIWSSNNALEATPESSAADSHALEGTDFSITYEKRGDDWLVLSGYEEGLIYYQRTEFGSDGILRGIKLKYPEAARQKYDPEIAAIAASLSGPQDVTPSGAQ